ncbi:MAG TPA: CHASE2 domain-containing protein, partial [Aquifex aeolicus]|nr:CHASE2 domain-containing protein [Aquifex aeolicus]
MGFRVIVFLLTGTAVSLLCFFRPALFERVALRVEDTKFAVREFLGQVPEVSENVVVVAIDEKSVNELGRWPWSRRVMAELVDKLREARVVALDIVFSEPEAEEADRRLARSIHRNGNV